VDSAGNSSVASLAANVTVAEPTATGRVIAAWPAFAPIASYELLMLQIRHAAEASTFGGGRAGPRPPTSRVIGWPTRWVTTSPRESSVAAGRHRCLLFDVTADPPQMPPEGV
jgi:hypothetical protein